MLQITIPETESWDEDKEVFIHYKAQTLQLEHSLVSLSKWESRWNKVFLSNKAKTFEETVDYIKCMTITQNVNPEIYNNLTRSNIDEINRYIEAPMTATYINADHNKGSSREPVTSELIYHWMIELGIPFECKKWHLNRLLTLIKVRNVKSQPPRRRGQRAIMRDNAALNAQRRKQLNTKG